MREGNKPPPRRPPEPEPVCPPPRMNENDGNTPPPETGQPSLPPVIGESQPPSPTPRNIAGWRWGAHLLVLISYVLLLGLLGASSGKGADEPMLPGTTRGLLTVCATELLVFGVVFLGACLFSRADKTELLLHWRDGIKPLVRGLLYSVALRAVVAVGMAVIVVGLMLFSGNGKESIEKLRPKTEALISAGAMTNNPVYLILMLTLVSFVVAGLREELWRSGVFAGLKGLFPSLFANRAGKVAAAALIAVVFGLGHLPQGWGGAGATAALGFGLGLIMLRHNSIWESVLAHGFFDATSFALLYAMELLHPDFLKQLAGLAI